MDFLKPKTMTIFGGTQGCVCLFFFMQIKIYCHTCNPICFFDVLWRQLYRLYLLIGGLKAQYLDPVGIKLRGWPLKMVWVTNFHLHIRAGFIFFKVLTATSTLSESVWAKWKYGQKGQITIIYEVTHSELYKNCIKPTGRPISVLKFIADFR